MKKHDKEIERLLDEHEDRLYEYKARAAVHKHLHKHSTWDDALQRWLTREQRASSWEISWAKVVTTILVQMGNLAVAACLIYSGVWAALFFSIPLFVAANYVLLQETP